MDPEALFALGAPGDEHSSEVDALTSLVVRGDVSEAAVLEVWERAFGPGSGLSTRSELLAALTGRCATFEWRILRRRPLLCPLIGRSGSPGRLAVRAASGTSDQAVLLGADHLRRGRFLPHPALDDDLVTRRILDTASCAANSQGTTFG